MILITTTYVEGLGNEVLISGVTLVVILSALCWLLWLWLGEYSGTQSVHADSASLVDDVREEQRRRTDHPVENSSVSNDSGTSRVDSRMTQRITPDQTCPICMDNLRFATQTNCSHIFCGQCFVSWWEHGRWTGPAKCPVCRQQVCHDRLVLIVNPFLNNDICIHCVSILLPRYTDEERLVSSEAKSFVVQKTGLYNRRFSGQPLLWYEYIRDLPTILRHCMADFFSFGGLLWMFRLRIVVCFVIALLYLISPLDIIPEMVFGFFGLLDDLFVMLLLLIYITIIYRRFVASRPMEHEHTS